MASAQATITVPGGQPTIQAAINAAHNGDIVTVSPGTYQENLNFNGKAITVQSQGGAGVTIIDGRNLAPVVVFSSSEGPNSVLKGFTLQHGNANGPFDSGGGIDISSASPTIEDNIVANNVACGSGGGIEVDFSSAAILRNIVRNNQQSGCSGGPGGGGIGILGAGNATITGNSITGNSFGVGGGLTLFAAGTPTITDNVIQGNTAQNSQGGGMWIVNDSPALIAQNLIIGNTSSEGAGIEVLVPSGSLGPKFVNNTLAGNIGSAAIFASGFHNQEQFVNNIVVGGPNQGAINCDATYDRVPPDLRANNAFSSGGASYMGSCSGAAGHNGNISADPLFVNPSAGNYHLLAGSPSIGAGTVDAPNLPLTDLDGKPRVVDGHVDQGVYETQSGTNPAITTASLPGANVGTAYSASLAASGGNPPYSWSISAGSLPAGLQLSASGGQISGTPTATGTFTFTAQVTDLGGRTATKALSITVNRALTTITLSVVPDHPSFGTPVTFVAAVAPASPNSVPVTGTVSFYLDRPGIAIATVPVVAGQARFTDNDLGAGTHVVGAVYNGDANFAFSVSTAKVFTVGTGLTVTGPHPGSIVVPSGSTVLLLHAEVGGSVVVSPGGALDVEGSTIHGSLIVNRAAAIRVCGSVIDGSLNVSQGTGIVHIGAPGDVSCAPNTVGGPILLPR